ncbi:efflux RND transporter periplasmic adaptor subunit [uncultured Phenylobacterium sp.]|uniref:efflux RND transporter periplasmic adaptor subunit n=1 Tax=uncultured Phenylobacterium sp. TaxID=349273 RepID=UPI0026014012|nr:efflux RND transporter periplasmic adaptor subunit [uncultured Phenylobacterium sp.]
MAIHRKVLVPAGLAALLMAGVAGFIVLNRPAEVTTSVVKPQKTERVIAVVGRVRPVERVDVRAINAGQVVRLLHDEGDTVAAGAPLAIIKAVFEKAQAEAELARAKAVRARAAEALQTFGRTKALFDRGFAAQAALDQARAELRTAEAEVAAAESSARAAIERTQEFVVRAPSASVVLARPIDTGQVVDTTTVLFELGSVSGGEIEAEVDEAYGDAIRPGMPARIATTGGSRIWSGRVSEVSPRVDASTGGRLVRLTYDAGADLVPGRSVDVTIVVRSAETLMLVPRQVVVDATVAPKVYVVDKDDTVGVRRVRIADWPSVDAIVESGVAAGERIVLEPGAVSPGERVRVKEEQ